MTKEQKEREHRIAYEVVVDCYTPEEQMMGWYYYFEDEISFPCSAHVTIARKNAALPKGTKVTILGLEDEEECERGIFVIVETPEGEHTVRPEHLEPTKKNVKQVFDDWKWWTGKL